MLFILDNQKHLLTNAYVHGYDTRKKKIFIYTCCKFILCSKRSL